MPYRLLPAPCHAMPNQSALCHTQPNVTEPNTRRMAITNHLSTVASSLLYRALPCRTVPLRSQPDPSQPPMPVPAPPLRAKLSFGNTRRMTVTNHLSTISSSLPCRARPRLSTPCQTDPDRIAPNQTTRNQSAWCRLYLLYCIDAIGLIK
jgi:hypothetical protein